MKKPGRKPSKSKRVRICVTIRQEDLFLLEKYRKGVNISRSAAFAVFCDAATTGGRVFS